MAGLSEATEEKIARYLDNAALALASANAARNRDAQKDYLAIAESWIKLAERTFDLSQD
jgi:hypothetical protein